MFLLILLINLSKFRDTAHLIKGYLLCCKAGLMWVAKRATLLFNSFCSNVAKHVACLLTVLSQRHKLLKLPRANLHFFFPMHVWYATKNNLTEFIEKMNASREVLTRTCSLTNHGAAENVSKDS